MLTLAKQKNELEDTDPQHPGSRRWSVCAFCVKRFVSIESETMVSIAAEFLQILSTTLHTHAVFFKGSLATFSKTLYLAVLLPYQRSFDMDHKGYCRNYVRASVIGIAQPCNHLKVLK